MLQEFGMCSVSFVYFFTHLVSPINAKELFNLRHAQARNVIERIFGVLKQHFRILLLPPHYSLDFQPRIPAALCALQNFIRKIDQNEGAPPTDISQAAYEPFPTDIDGLDNSGLITGDDDEGNSAVKLRRMNIANEMWQQYLQYRADAETSEEDNSDDFNSDS